MCVGAVVVVLGLVLVTLVLVLLTVLNSVPAGICVEACDDGVKPLLRNGVPLMAEQQLSGGSTAQQAAAGASRISQGQSDDGSIRMHWRITTPQPHHYTSTL